MKVKYQGRVDGGEVEHVVESMLSKRDTVDNTRDGQWHLTVK